jgi:ribosomal protein S18 acetylase RimI-like enzyme
MEIRRANVEDCRAIAELAMMAGEGIPGFFWEQARQAGEDVFDVGARNAASETANFSYRNAHVALIDDEIAGMLLAYRLPDAGDTEDLAEFPAFIRPLIELEHCVPGSFYINMLATYPQFRNRAVGSTLMGGADSLAAQAGCELISIQVFEQNTGALRLYQRLGYTIIERRAVVPHPCHPYQGDVVLLTRPVAQGAQARESL